MNNEEKLGRFNHHPDPAIDFCCEVDALQGLAYEVSVGTSDRQEVALRINRAMSFTVGGDEHAVVAKQVLRQLEKYVGEPVHS